MSSVMVDRASDLIEALKIDPKNFELSNLIFKNHNALRSVYEFYSLKSDLLEFAKDPKVGLELLGPPPRRPTPDDLGKMSDEEKENTVHDYMTMVKMYEDRKRAMEIHVPVEDLIMINAYLEKYEKTFHATPAVKGLRFKAFTKDVEHEEKGILAGLFKRGNQQQ